MLPASALIVASAMSRFDVDYLASRSLGSWREAFQEASEVFLRPSSSIKMLRDEFDAHYPNSRQGWSKASMRPPILRTITETAPLSQELHMELVRCALSGSVAELAPVTALIAPPLDATAVARRLLTGRLAEEWFQEHAPALFPPAAQGLIDCRQSAMGYDFASTSDASVVIEVKGIADESGPLLFTDREWMTALEKESHYWLAVVSHVHTSPQLRALPNPARTLLGVRHERTTVVPEWRAAFVSSKYTVCE